MIKNVSKWNATEKVIRNQVKKNCIKDVQSKIVEQSHLDIQVLFFIDYFKRKIGFFISF